LNAVVVVVLGIVFLVLVLVLVVRFVLRELGSGLRNHDVTTVILLGFGVHSSLGIVYIIMTSSTA